jgi:hypothetical protein
MQTGQDGTTPTGQDSTTQTEQHSIHNRHQRQPLTAAQPRSVVKNSELVKQYWSPSMSPNPETRNFERRDDLRGKCESGRILKTPTRVPTFPLSDQLCNCGRGAAANQSMLCVWCDNTDTLVAIGTLTAPPGCCNFCHGKDEKLDH